MFKRFHFLDVFFLIEKIINKSTIIATIIKICIIVLNNMRKIKLLYAIIYEI